MIAWCGNPCAPVRCRTIPIAFGRLALLSSLLVFVIASATAALGRGGTNMHELSTSRAVAPDDKALRPGGAFGNCGRGRYRDPRTHSCRGPADFGN
jgi:hypothetical protein